MSDFRDAELLFAWVYALTRIEPGDFATVRLVDDAAIRARNRECTPTEVWHYDSAFAGLAGGETGV